MASGKFRIKTNNDWNTIFYRFKHSNKFDLECSTGIQIPNKRWSDSKQEVLSTNLVDYVELNCSLKELDARVRKEFEKAKQNAEVINTNWLKNSISLFFKRETNNSSLDANIFLTNYITNFIEESKNKKTRNNTPIKKRTIQHYFTTQNKIVAFEVFIGKKITLEDVNLSFHSKFIDFLEVTQKLNPNTIGGYIDDIKLFCSNADKKGLQVPKDYKLSEFYTPSNKTKDIYLKDDEINAIYDYHFEQEYLDNAKDWFIIGLRTGLRISDFLKLTSKNIVDGFIEKQTIKTDFPVIIPIHEQVNFILEKRKGNFPRRISDQKFNDYVKIICQKVGLTEMTEGAKVSQIEVTENGKKKMIYRKQFGVYPKFELVTSHICRRSFATNLYGKIDTLTIMKITGHKTEAQFLSYIKITPREYAEKLKQYWKSTTI